jgi:hypothetical protein
MTFNDVKFAEKYNIEENPLLNEVYEEMIHSPRDDQPRNGPIEDDLFHPLGTGPSYGLEILLRKDWRRIIGGEEGLKKNLFQLVIHDHNTVITYIYLINTFSIDFLSGMVLYSAFIFNKI